MAVSKVSIRCFGGVALEREGVPAAGRATQRRRLALLLLLAGSRGQPVSRDRLTAYLWPESDAEGARHLLSGAIYELRKVLGEHAILSRGDDVWLDTTLVACDVAGFEIAMEQGRIDDALALYRGPFADGFHVSAAPEFERWLDERRGHYRRLFRRAVETRAVSLSASGDARGAAEAWLRSAAEDPADARVLIEAMRALDSAGNRAAALRQASVYEAFVRGEFGAEPAAEVLAVAESMRRGERPVPRPTKKPAESPQVGTPRRIRSMPGALWVAGATTAVILALAVGRFATRGAAAPDEHAGRNVAHFVVLPFKVPGDSTAMLGKEVADLLSASLDGAGDLRAIRSDTADGRLVNRGDLDSANARATAERFGARFYITGTLHEAAGTLHARAQLHERGRGGALGTASAVSTANRPFALADTLATQLLAVWLSKPAERLSGSAARSTRSLGAIKAYLVGEQDRRAGRFAAAAESFGRAVEADSTFALAYYRLSMMTLAADLPWAEAVAADDRAFRYGGRLAERDRLLIRGYRAFRRGDAETAEQIYHGLIATYPDDLEAWRQLGETFFHYNALRGRPIAEARAPFERVLAHEPNDWDAMWHLAQLDAIQGRRSAAIAFIDRLLALGPAPPQSLELRALRAFASGAPQEQTALMPELRRADELQLHQIIWRTAVYLGDLAAAERVARLLTEPSRPRYAEQIGRRDLAAMELARGRWRAAEAEINASAMGNPAWRDEAVYFRGMVSAMAVPSRPRAELSPLRDSLAALRPTLQHRVAVRLTLLALLDVGLGDTASAAKRIAELERLERNEASTVARASSNAPTAEPSNVPHSASLLARRAALARAALARHRGQTEVFLAQTEIAFAMPWFGFALTNMEHSQSLERFARAEALRVAGQHQRAINWYASFAEHSPHDLAFLGPSHLRRAELYEKLNQPARAAEHYARFVELWKDCDEELRPLREQARARLAVLRK